MQDALPSFTVVGRESRNLAEAPNDEVVAIRSIQAEHVQNHHPLCGVDDLTDTEERFAFRRAKQFGGPRIGCGGVHFLVCVSKLNVIVALQQSEQRLAMKRSGKKSGELSRRKVACLQSKRFTRGVPEA